MGRKSLLFVVETAVFGTDEELAFSVAIEVDGAGAGAVAGDFTLGEVAGLFEDGLALELTFVAVEFGIDGVDDEVEIPVAVPVDDIDFSAAAFAGVAGVEGDEATIFVNEDPLAGKEDEGAVGGFFALEEGEVAFVIEDDEVVDLILVPIDDDGGGAPLGDKVFVFGCPPVPRGFWGFVRPGDGDGLGGAELGLGEGADVLIPENFPPDGVDHDVGEFVVVPVADGEGGVAPFGFAGALDGAVWSGLDVDGFVVGFEEDGGGPFGSGFADEIFGREE